MSILCTSPLAKGLFRRVILESSIVASGEPPHSFRSMEEALSSGEEVLARYRAENVSDLRKLPAESIAGSMDTAHHITVHGYVLTETPSKSYQEGLHKEGAILHGFNLHDSAAFLVFSKTTKGTMDSQVREYYGAHADDLLKLYPSADDKQAVEDWGEIYGAVFFDYPYYTLNKLAMKNGIPLYEYLLAKENGRLGTWHSGEEIYCFGNISPIRNSLTVPTET